MSGFLAGLSDAENRSFFRLLLVRILLNFEVDPRPKLVFFWVVHVVNIGKPRDQGLKNHSPGLGKIRG